MVHFYNDLLFSLEKKGNSHICNTWVNLQDIMLSEIVKWSESQSCLTLCDPTDHTVHGILQARILEWVAFPFSRGSSQPRDQTQVSRIAGGFFTSWVIREACNKGSEISQLQKTNYYMIPFISGIQGSQIQRWKREWQLLSCSEARGKRECGVVIWGTWWESQVVPVVKNPPANAGVRRETGSIPVSGRSPGGGHGSPLQCSCLENPHGQRSLAGYSL